MRAAKRSRSLQPPDPGVSYQLGYEPARHERDEHECRAGCNEHHLGCLHAVSFATSLRMSAIAPGMACATCRLRPSFASTHAGSQPTSSIGGITPPSRRTIEQTKAMFMA